MGDWDMSQGTPAEAAKRRAAEVIDAEMADLLKWYKMFLIADLADLGVPINLLAQAVVAGFSPKRLLGVLYKSGPKVENGLLLELVFAQRRAAETCEPEVVVEASEGR